MPSSERHRSREPLAEAGMALSRAIAFDRALAEIAAQVRRVAECDAVAVALSGAESAPRLVHQTGFAEASSALERRLAPAWRDALDDRAPTVRGSGEALDITAPMTGTDGIVGLLTATYLVAPSPKVLEERRRALAAMASDAAAALERVQLVERTLGAERLRALAEVAAGVAQELRNPLFAISSAAQLLRFRVKDDPVVEKNVGRILREVERLNAMAAALLDYGRPAPIVLAVGDPDAVWDDVLDTQRGRLESRALLLERKRADPPGRCAIDAGQLGQAFVQLLANATDAAPEGSDLSLSSETLPGGAWRCRLRNAGAPIPADVLPRVFELLFTTRPGSTGMGLSICQRIIEEHRGTVHLESPDASGTIATVTLPAG